MKMVFIRKESLAKRLENFETKLTETICIEFLTFTRKWCIIFINRSPNQKKNKKKKQINKSKLVSIKTNDFIKDENVLLEMPNNNYININEKTSGIAPESLGDSSFKT